MKMYQFWLRFWPKFVHKALINNIPALVQIMTWHRPDYKPLSELMMVNVQYIPRNMHTVFALLCFVVVIHWLIFPYPSGLLHWHCGNLTIAPVPAKQPWWIWINTSCEFIMRDCITTTKQSTTKPCAYFLGYTVLTRIYNYLSMPYPEMNYVSNKTCRWQQQHTSTSITFSWLKKFELWDWDNVHWTSVGSIYKLRHKKWTLFWRR